MSGDSISKVSGAGRHRLERRHVRLGLLLTLLNLLLGFHELFGAGALNLHRDAESGCVLCVENVSILG